MTKFKKIWLLMIIFLAVFSFCMLVVFDIQGAEPQQNPVLDGGGNLTFGYVQELDLAIVSSDIVLYINPEERFRSAVFIGMEIPVDSIYSEAIHFAQLTIGGTFNYDVLYALAQGYYILDGDNDFDYQLRLAIGIKDNMPYRTNLLRRNPFLSIGVDFSFGYLPNLECYFAKFDTALYIRPDKLMNGVIFGGYEDLVEPAKKYGGSVGSFCPYQDRYSIGVALNIAMFSFRWEHYCIHPVWSCREQFENKFYAENCTKISFGVQHKFPFKVRRIGW